MEWSLDNKADRADYNQIARRVAKTGVMITGESKAQNRQEGAKYRHASMGDININVI
jgi:hypothetical protein